MRQTSLNEVYKLAQIDSRVVFVGSDIGSGTLDGFKKEFPDRFFMEGVCEAHLIGMMVGLAMNGKIPYFNTIATFLTRRSYEQVLIDGGLHRQKIRLLGSGGGVVYAPLGPTHLATEDIALMRTIPNMTILAPSDAEEMKMIIPQTLDIDGPVYIRLGKGGDPVIFDKTKGCTVGKATVYTEGNDALIISTGVTTKRALDAADMLKSDGIQACVVHLHTLKPIDRDLLSSKMSKVRAIVTLEEHSLIGGLGSIVAEILAESNFNTPKKFSRIGLPDKFIEMYGSQDIILEEYGVTAQNTAKTVKALLNG